MLSQVTICDLEHINDLSNISFSKEGWFTDEAGQQHPQTGVSFSPLKDFQWPWEKWAEVIKLHCNVSPQVQIRTKLNIILEICDQVYFNSKKQQYGGSGLMTWVINTFAW